MSLQFDIKVVPASGRSAFVLDKSGHLKCFLKNQAQDGKANLELIKLLAKKVGVTMTNIEIAVGATNRKKTIRINNTTLSYLELLAALQLDQQQGIFK
jgi:uncharacterized protein (TIGR00251 family)